MFDVLGDPAVLQNAGTQVFLCLFRHCPCVGMNASLYEAWLTTMNIRKF